MLVLHHCFLWRASERVEEEFGSPAGFCWIGHLPAAFLSLFSSQKYRFWYCCLSALFFVLPVCLKCHFSQCALGEACVCVYRFIWTPSGFSVQWMGRQRAGWNNSQILSLSPSSRHIHVSGLRLKCYAIEQQSPTFLSPGTGFVEDNFSMECVCVGGGGVGLGMI